MSFLFGYVEVYIMLILFRMFFFLQSESGLARARLSEDDSSLGRALSTGWGLGHCP